MVFQNDRILFSYKLMDKGNIQGKSQVYKTYLMNNTLKEYYNIGVGYPYNIGHILKKMEPIWDVRRHDICIRYSTIPDGFTAV